MKLFLTGPAGKLEAIFDESSRPNGGAALVCHPHPVHGGTMHNRVVVRLVRAFLNAGFDVLRLNFRGAGESDGSYDSGIGERADARTGLEFLKQERPGGPLCVGGFSFGSWVGFNAALEEPQVKGLLAVGMPLKHFDFDFLRTVTLPKWTVQGEHDEFGLGPRVRALMESCVDPKGFSMVADADHFFTDHIEQLSVELEMATTWLKENVR
ncbi:MAG: alpha/beta fold hydrolase [Blastocatellia bacterium]|nr:alpha/beta fold hydrolase [Blastocatellia bacterium]